MQSNSRSPTNRCMIVVVRIVKISFFVLISSNILWKSEKLAVFCPKKEFFYKAFYSTEFYSGLLSKNSISKSILTFLLACLLTTLVSSAISMEGEEKL